MKLLIITNLFPNKQEPNRATFNFQQIQEMDKLCELKVVAPLPYFQYSGKQVSSQESIFNIPVFHPRYLVIPEILRCLYGILFFAGVLGTVLKIRTGFNFDKILVTWAYPDAFGVALIAKVLGKPFVVKVHGTDINTADRYFLRKKMIAYALRKAQKVISVTAALKQKMIDMGIPADKVVVIPNGVDCEVFRLLDKDKCRTELKLSHRARHVTFIGNLEDIKGVRFLIKAFLNLPHEICLNIVGDGRLRNELQALARNLTLSDRIDFAGRRPHSEMPYWMNASDVFCLPSLDEGCPNVVLEALACGTPVVASNVGGIPDIITSVGKGILVSPGNSPELAKAIKKVISSKIKRTKLRESVWGNGWEENAKKVMGVLEDRGEKIEGRGGI